MKCGVSLKETAPVQEEGRDWLTALLLCSSSVCLEFTGSIQAIPVSGLFQLLTLGGCGIWALIDFIMIIVGSFRDAEGHLLVRDNKCTGFSNQGRCS